MKVKTKEGKARQLKIDGGLMKVKEAKNSTIGIKGDSVKTKQVKSKRFKKGNSVKTKEAKPTILNTIFLNLQTTVEECVDIIKAFEEEGYTTHYDSKTKVLKTTAPKTKIKELSKQFKCIQSFDYSVIDRNPNNSNSATDRNPIKEQK